MHSFKNKWCIIYLDYKELYNLNTINGIESEEVMGAHLILHMKTRTKNKIILTYDFIMGVRH